MTDQSLLDRLVDISPVAPRPLDADELVRRGRRRLRRRRAAGAAALLPIVAGSVLVGGLVISRPASSAPSRVTAAAPAVAPALVAPDAETVAYFNPYDWFERAPVTTQPAISRSEAIAAYRRHEAAVSPALAKAPVTAVLGIYHRVDPRYAADGAELPGTALTPLLAWAIVQGPGSGLVASGVGGVAGHRICYAAAIIDATTGTAPTPDEGISVDENCSTGVTSPIVVSGRPNPSSGPGAAWALMHTLPVPAAFGGSQPA